MKKRTLFKGLCMTVATSLLAAVLPMGAMAADGVKTIAVDFDTYTQRSLTNDYSGSTSICYQDNNNNDYDREAFFGFDLSKLEIPEGKVIDTAEITVYSYSFKNASAGAESTTASADVSMYAMGNVDWTTAGVITWADHYKSDKVKIATTAFAPEGTFTRGDSSVFDVSDYLNGKSSGKELFVIYPDKAGVTGYIYAMEESDGKYAATLAVTCKDDDGSSDVVLTQTIKANADVDIRASKSDATLANKCHEGATTMRSYRNSQWSATGGYPSEAWVRFNLSDIKIPAGKQIDTAKVKIYLQYYNNTDAPKNGGTRYDAAPLDLYAMTAGEYDPATVCWNTEGRPKATGVIATTILCPENVFTQRDAYEFDISEYITSKSKLEGNETFSFYPTNTNKLDVSIYTSEQSEGAYTPELIVTFKDAEPVTSITLPVADSRIVTDVADQNATSTNTYGLRNFGNAYKSIAKFAFDIYDIDSLIPEGKVIKSAELSYYVTSKSKNSNSSNNVTAQSIRVMNYDDNYWIDPSVKSAEDSLATWTITDEMTGETYNDDAAEAVRTGYQFSISGENHIYEGLEELDYEGAKAVTIDKWFSVDVTEYFISQMNNEDAMGYVSFALTPSQSENGPVYVANGWNPKAPKITLTLADAGEGEALEIGKPVYISGYTEGTEIEQVTAGKRIAIAIPVSGKTETPVNAKIYLAAYNGDELVKISAHDFAFYQGEGNLYYYFNTVEGTTAVKAFIWTGDNVPVVETDVLSVVAAE